jgi:hypothetical protein
MPFLPGSIDIRSPNVDFVVAPDVPPPAHECCRGACSLSTGRNSNRSPRLSPEQILRRFHVAPDARSGMLADLHRLGIHHSTAFPDLDGLAKELSAEY